MGTPVFENEPNARGGDTVFGSAARAGFLEAFRRARLRDAAGGGQSEPIGRELRRAIDDLLRSIRQPLPPPERLLVAFKDLLRAERPLAGLSTAGRERFREALVSECIDSYFALRDERARGPRRSAATS